MHTVKYFNLVRDEKDIRNESFKWNEASTFSYDRNTIGLAVALQPYALICRYMAPLTP